MAFCLSCDVIKGLVAPRAMKRPCLRPSLFLRDAQFSRFVGEQEGEVEVVWLKASSDILTPRVVFSSWVEVFKMPWWWLSCWLFWWGQWANGHRWMYRVRSLVQYEEEEEFDWIFFFERMLWCSSEVVMFKKFNSPAWLHSEILISNWLDLFGTYVYKILLYLCNIFITQLISTVI